MNSLEYFLKAYLHQDYKEVSGDEWGALDELLHDDPHHAAPLAAEIESVLEAYPDDASLEDHLVATGTDFLPPRAECRAWLAEVARRARRV